MSKLNWSELRAVVSVAVLLQLLGPAAGQSWSYDDQAAWPLLFPACGGDRQSPTNIAPTAEYFRGLSPILRVAGNLNNAQVTLENSGKTVDIELSSYFQIRILRRAFSNLRGGGTYVLDSFHFHWGNPEGGLGSEHTLDGQRTAAELHFVMYKKRYGSVANALTYSDGLVVLALMLVDTVSPNMLVFPEASLNLQSTAQNVRRPGQTFSYRADVTPLLQLAQAATGDFLVYSGSLTTPPCAEVATFLVSQRGVSVTPSFLQTLTTTFYTSDTGDEILVDNYRFEQPRNGRAVNRYQ